MSKTEQQYQCCIILNNEPLIMNSTEMSLRCVGWNRNIILAGVFVLCAGLNDYFMYFLTEQYKLRYFSLLSRHANTKFFPCVYSCMHSFVPNRPQYRRHCYKTNYAKSWNSLWSETPVKSNLRKYLHKRTHTHHVNRSTVQLESIS